MPPTAAKTSPSGAPIPNGAANGNGAKSNGAGEHRWTFLTNHAHVLIQLHSDPGLVLREVAARVGITERAVQRIVQELEEEGFIERTRVGRRNEYRVLSGNHFRHPIESHCKVGDLLELVNDRSVRQSE